MKTILPGLLAACLAVAHAESLSNDGRIGKVIDSQGIASVKPVMHGRWTLAEDDLLLKPGDWLRTDNRGANALHVRLGDRTRLILGPGSLVEAVDVETVRLFQGEIEISTPEKAQVQLLAPGDQKVAVTGTQVFRARLNQFQKLDKEPNWLQGFKGTVTTESMGSLLANVEGRNVPLTVGYHKVTVDIRDQIARTVVEESFVNHTDGTLEGVFYFPMPQDASISGFAMWIGDQCVEADVVEKQRAREIYETILRERRDPGLLEWSGGNIFKARVFPIFGHSEKRIKITYTQVLPLKGGRCRYSYALQSELLKQHPLRELAIDVRVYSALPLKEVVCKTHEARADKTAHAGHVEFTAQEYTPDRDFEVEIEVDHRNSPVALVPHRRGDDGYFLLLLTPPDAGGEWQRAVLPDGNPLDFVILADTSGSMDDGQRATQDAFIAALLASLSEKDTFNLTTCDVECLWFGEKAVPATESNISAARDFLAARVSLGWTDLDKAFEAVKARVGPKTQVVYLGDGIITTGDGDPVAFTKRVRQLYQETSAVFHAVSTGSSFEPVVMKAIASLGGGSMRRIEGSNGPQAVARELLGEATQPTIRDLRIEFKGLRTARVYPQELPNLPAGSQQIILGRFLPEPKQLKGEVIVSGLREGKQIQFRAQVSLPDSAGASPASSAENAAENSFIPRLWARLHLDVLLDQGASPEVKEEVIALSEEYNIMTPYTSFLVLESDADRERFAVKKRFRMRDGEKFFAEGRDSANFELVQQQMKRAGNWRTGLRQRILNSLADLGRNLDPGKLLAEAFWTNPNYWSDRDTWSKQVRGHLNAPRFDAIWTMDGDRGPPVGDLFAGEGDEEKAGFTESLSRAESELRLGEKGEVIVTCSESAAPVLAGEPSQPSAGAPEGEEELGYDMPADKQMMEERRVEHKKARLDYAAKGPAPSRTAISGRASGLYDVRDLLASIPDYSGTGLPEMSAGKALPAEVVRVREEQGRAWLHPIFPDLPAPPQPPAETETRWTDEARSLADSLLRTDKLKAMAEGLEIARKAESYDPARQEVSSVRQEFILLSAKSWLVRSSGDAAQALIHWCSETERGALSKPFLLGRVRKTVPLDLTTYGFSLSDASLVSLAHTRASYVPTVEDRGNGQVLLKLVLPDNPNNYEMRYLIDTARHVALRLEGWSQGKLTSTTSFEDFIQAGGAWWAQRIESRNADGKLTHVESFTFRQLAPDALAKSVAEELGVRKDSLVLEEPFLLVLDAKQALLDGKPTFGGQIVMLSHFAQSQQWERVTEHFEALKKLADGKPGFQWIENAVLQLKRRNEELRERLFKQAEAFVAQTTEDELFLANHLRNTASSACQNNEMLTFLGLVRPVYARQPERTNALREWERDRSCRLYDAGQQDEALKLMKRLAERYPSDESFQSLYAAWLVGAGEYEAAYQWLEKALAAEGRWQPYQADNLRNQVMHSYENQGRLLEQADYLARWVAGNPLSQNAYERYLSALIRTDQLDKANELTAQWLAVPGDVEEMTPTALSRLNAAINTAIGNGYGISTNRIDERWFEPLSGVVRALALSKTQFHSASRIITDWRFQQTDACRALRKEFAEVLRKDAGTLDLRRVLDLVNWVWPNDPVVELPVWKEISGKLEARWTEEKEVNARNQLGESVVRILSGRVGVSENLAFLHRQWREGPPAHKSHYASQLFEALLSQPWSQEYEDEAFSLLYQLGDASQRLGKLSVQVPALYRLDDWVAQARYRAGVDAIERKEELSRTELRAKQLAVQRAARTGLVARIRKEVGEAKSDAQKMLVLWLNVERLYFETLLRKDPADIAAECWEYLGTEPPRPEKPLEWHQALLFSRYFETLEYLASRPKADKAVSERLLAYLAKGIEANPDDSAWKQHKYRLLVALDRPAEMEKALRSWIRPGGADRTWRLALGYLLAETNRIPEAIQQFEAIKAADDLLPAEYRTLADWYMAANEREKHEEAQIQALMTMDEWRLNSYLNSQRNRWENRETVPEELDPQVVRVFTALFRKSQQPQNYLWELQRIYQNSKDFRLLECLSEGMLGHTAETVYPFLQQLQGVLNDMLDEAASDSIVDHLAEVRERAKTPVDRRALDMFEVQVKRRAAEVKNQPGPHVEAALAAMQRAFKGEWLPGERRLMADLLASLGRISQAPLAAEQVKQLESLHRAEKPDTYDRLHIAHAWARCLWTYSKQNEAVDLLQSALEEYRQASGGRLPVAAQAAFGGLISHLESQRHHARGEKAIFAELERPANQHMTYWLRQRLYELYGSAIRNKTEVLLGGGQRLYKAVEKRLWDELGTTDRNHCYGLLGQLCGIYQAAHDTKLEGVPGDLKTFAYGRFAEVLGTQTNNHQAMVSSLAETKRRISGPLEALAFLVERMEKEPSWFRYAGQDGWNHHSWRLGQWRSEAGNIGDLAPRLLKIVTDELRRDLETRQERNRSMYWRDYGHFWAEKADAFAAVAEEVWQKRRASGAAVSYIARYLFDGLGRHQRATDMLLEAYGRNILDEGAQAQLVDYLHQTNRHQESIPVLVKLVDWRRDNIHYRVELLHAYFRTDQGAALRKLLVETDTYFHEKGLWGEHVISQLAHSCLTNQLYPESVIYYKEVIPLHQRTQPGRGIGNGTLSSYYGYLAQAYQGLGQTADAVEAASGAIVSWGSSHHNRQNAIEALKGVLRGSPDVDGYAALLDKQVSQTGLENPIVRKALGQVYLEKRQFDKAIRHLSLAVQVQPNDAETHQALVSAYDQQSDKEGAIRQLLASAKLSRRNLALYPNLGNRLSGLGKAQEAERAYTCIVEMQPTESESHTMLAEIRQQQNRWPEAIVHWQQVAKIRALEPTGLEKLAQAQIHEKRWDDARESIDMLLDTTWPERFGDVRGRAMALRNQVPEKERN
jgi:tetratricopeptide (TPR) repeat protein